MCVDAIERFGQNPHLVAAARRGRSSTRDLLPPIVAPGPSCAGEVVFSNRRGSTAPPLIMRGSASKPKRGPGGSANLSNGNVILVGGTTSIRPESPSTNTFIIEEGAPAAKPTDGTFPRSAAIAPPRFLRETSHSSLQGVDGVGRRRSSSDKRSSRDSSGDNAGDMDSMEAGNSSVQRGTNTIGQSTSEWARGIGGSLRKEMSVGISPQTVEIKAGGSTAGAGGGGVWGGSRQVFATVGSSAGSPVSEGEEQQQDDDDGDDDMEDVARATGRRMLLEQQAGGSMKHPPIITLRAMRNQSPKGGGGREECGDDDGSPQRRPAGREGSGFDEWGLIGEDNMWEKAISGSTKALGTATTTFVKEASRMAFFRFISVALRVTGLNAPTLPWAIYSRVLLLYVIFRLACATALFCRTLSSATFIDQLSMALMVCWLAVCAAVHSSLLSWRKLDLMLAIRELVDSTTFAPRLDLISHVIRHYVLRVMPLVVLPAALFFGSVFIIVVLHQDLPRADGGDQVLSLLSDLSSYPYADKLGMVVLSNIMYVFISLQQLTAISLYIIMLTFLHLRFRELHRRITEEAITMAEIFQEHYDLCQRTRKVDFRFRHFTTALLLGYTAFLLFSLNILVAFKPAHFHESPVIPLIAITTIIHASAILGAFLFFTMRISAWHDKLFHAAFDRPDDDLSGRTMRQGDKNERMHRLLAWRLKEFQPSITIFNGAIPLTSRLFVKSTSMILTIFYLAIQLQKKQNTGTGCT